MRRIPLPPSASIHYQLREILFSYTPRGGLSHSAPSSTPWPLGYRHDKTARRALSTSATAAASESLSTELGNSANDGNGPDAQNHDRNNTTARQDDDRTIPALPNLPYKFDTGIALFAKRAPRPFPPPFLSPPSVSFSDPLSTHHRSRDRRPKVDGELIKGWTNGDDAVFASQYFIGANDGVGAWSARPRGHAG